MLLQAVSQQKLRFWTFHNSKFHHFIAVHSSNPSAVCHYNWN